MRNNGHVQLTGTSSVMSELRQEIERIARSEAKVLITGESGVGKELVAHAVHAQSPRARRSFVAVNCAGLPETLLESELFGHVKGSFTGAYRDKPGKLELADGGTIFLDEIGEMTMRMQGLLLRFMETGELQKVGSDRTAGRVDVRVIAATNRNLREMVAQGSFREDLFYRLNVIHLTVPPLRERREDVPELVDYFMARFTMNNGYIVKGISPEALKMMCEYAWPGNVRELENVIERCVVTGRTEVGGRRRPADGRSHAAHRRAAPEARTPAHGGRRPVQAPGRGSGIILACRLPALHAARDHARQRSRPRSQGTRGGSGKLQDRGAALQYGTARLQAISKFSPQTRLSVAVQGIPAVVPSGRRRSPGVAAGGLLSP